MKKSPATDTELIHQILLERIMSSVDGQIEMMRDLMAEVAKRRQAPVSSGRRKTPVRCDKTFSAEQVRKLADAVLVATAPPPATRRKGKTASRRRRSRNKK